MWKRVVTTAILLIGVRPALAADPRPAPMFAAATVPSRAVSQGSQAATVLPTRAVSDTSANAIRDLSARVNSLEQKVDGLIPPPPTPEELKRQKQEQEQDQEFVQRVWTDG